MDKFILAIALIALLFMITVFVVFTSSVYADQMDNRISGAARWQTLDLRLTPQVLTQASNASKPDLSGTWRLLRRPPNV